jgi:uncharacterized DUF497 family protein
MIVWNEPKRLSIIAKHGLDFDDIGEEFFEAALDLPANEGRFKAIGWFGAIVIAVIYETRGATIRLISARPAHRSERKLFNG